MYTLWSHPSLLGDLVECKPVRSECPDCPTAKCGHSCLSVKQCFVHVGSNGDLFEWAETRKATQRRLDRFGEGGNRRSHDPTVLDGRSWLQPLLDLNHLLATASVAGAKRWLTQFDVHADALFARWAFPRCYWLFRFSHPTAPIPHTRRVERRSRCSSSRLADHRCHQRNIDRRSTTDTVEPRRLEYEWR